MTTKLVKKPPFSQSVPEKPSYTLHFDVTKYEHRRCPTAHKRNKNRFLAPISSYIPIYSHKNDIK